MGLDTTHECWSGSYSAFMRWRREIARAAGFPPLDLMLGFYSDDSSHYSGLLMSLGVDPDAALTASKEAPDKRWLCEFLPIRWDYFASDPLTKLLHHSDCDGEIAAADCGPIADRLEALLPKLPTGEVPGLIGTWRDRTTRFIKGLRTAAAAGEAVEFH